MSKTVLERPAADEYAEYYNTYISKVSGSDVLAFLEEQLKSVSTLLRGIDNVKGDFCYQPGKWSIKELIGHLIDAERVFAYRALVFSRNDPAMLPGFDQEVWSKHSNYGSLAMRDVIAEFEAVRRATILQFKHLDAAAWSRRGTANNKEMSVRA